MFYLIADSNRISNFASSFTFNLLLMDYSHLTENDILFLSVQFSLWTKSKGLLLRGPDKCRYFEISL